MRVGQGKSMSPFHQSCLDAVEADGRRERVFVLVSPSGAEHSLLVSALEGCECAARRVAVASPVTSGETASV